LSEYSIFDVIGPIMIGPSSSHTAGAARLGKVARIIGGENIKEVDFFLHGSFGKTYKGHGTDKALVAGILGMDPWDENLRHSFTIAEKKGIKYQFIEKDLGDVHPNTVRFILRKENDEMVVIMGSSIGGGNIVITEIDGIPMEFTGSYPTIITVHRDMPGVITQITNTISNENINIAQMKVFREKKGGKAIMIIETDSEINNDIIDSIGKVEAVDGVKIINM
jgi:L-serine dehydratase